MSQAGGWQAVHAEQKVLQQLTQPAYRPFGACAAGWEVTGTACRAASVQQSIHRAPALSRQVAARSMGSAHDPAASRPSQQVPGVLWKQSYTSGESSMRGRGSGNKSSSCCRWLSSHLQKPLPGANPQAGSGQSSNGKEKVPQVAALVSLTSLCKDIAHCTFCTSVEAFIHLEHSLTFTHEGYMGTEPQVKHVSSWHTS